MAEDGRKYHQEHHLVSVKAAEDPEKLPTLEQMKWNENHG